ncbi:cytochrome P450 [Mycena latifolia]|nr:cytochrome P450 [Mycena latifolia]
MALTLTYLALLAAVVYLAVSLVRRLPNKRLPLPPGPPGVPILGNVLNFPGDRAWIAFNAMSSKFNSDVLYFNLLGTPIIVLNSVQAAEDLLNQRSVIYSDRPRFVMLNEVVAAGWMIALLPYGKRWKDVRKVFHQGYQGALSSEIPSSQLHATRMFLKRLLSTPDDFLGHIRLMTGGLILSATYGIDVVATDDPYLESAARGLEAASTAGSPGRYYAVEALPFLKHLPSWFPGAGFKRQAKEWSAILTEMRARPFAFLEASVAAGAARPSIGASLLRAMEEAKTSDDAYAREILKDTLALFYRSTAPIYSFFLAMVTHQDLQTEAQKAVDAVVGATRLPEFSDNIPMVDAIVRELLRWRPVSPLFVHAVKVDDEYKGHRIPAGSTVMFNQWCECHSDQNIYGPDTHEFRPARWLRDGQLDPAMPNIDPAFGFGRRFCPGMDMALKTIWLAVASLLATFDVRYSLDNAGCPIIPSGEYETIGSLSFPKAFMCRITPRSDDAKALILLHSGWVGPAVLLSGD